MKQLKIKDRLYARPIKQISDFVFDDNVAGVFDDMIHRSVPGYAAIIAMIGVLAQAYAKDSSNCYDLGCSLGTASLSMRANISRRGCKIIAVDNSQAMVTKCRQRVRNASGRSAVPVEVICDDIENVPISQASVVVLNFTLQFVKREKRGKLLRQIYQGLVSGGVIILSEKIVFKNRKEQKLQDELYHAFKKLNGYSDLEIAQKRTALEKVLIADTLDQHFKRLRKAGFKDIYVWFQCFNFVSMVAVK